MTPRRPRRRGTTLVYFVLMAFALLGVAALVIDVGFARLTAHEMWPATDTAALEGLRWRDGIPDNFLATLTEEEFDRLQDDENACGMKPDPGDPDYENKISIWKDCARRWFAREFIRITFDDGKAPGAPGKQLYGAGPQIPFVEGSDGNPVGTPIGETSFTAGEVIDQAKLTAAPYYNPYSPDDSSQLYPFKLNSWQYDSDTGNYRPGDMVSGKYQGMPGPNDDPAWFIHWHREAKLTPLDDIPVGYKVGDYIRPAPKKGLTPPTTREFEPITGRPASGKLPEDDAFLVRMRRNQPEFFSQPEGGSAGPSLPFLFGLGSLLDPALWKAHGIPVRSTSIAQAQPAMAVGVPYTPTDGSAPIPGVLPLGLSRTFWAQFVPTTATPPGSPLSPSFKLSQDTNPDRPAGALKADAKPTGRDANLLVWPTGRTATIAWRVATIANSNTPSALVAQSQFLPIFDTIEGTEWIVGFGLADVTISIPDDGSRPPVIQVTLRTGQIVPRNAAPLPLGGIEPITDGSRPSAVLQSIIDANASLRLGATNAAADAALAVLAPALVRSTAPAVVGSE